jgi:branched-chain amino acid aminotransferase
MQQRGTHEAVPDRRNEDVLVYINGEFFRREEARISVFDSGFLVGDGVWEGLRLHEGDFAFLEEHIDRLFQGAKAIGLEIGMTRQEITAALHETARRNGMTTDVHVRLMVTRGDKKTRSWRSCRLWRRARTRRSCWTRRARSPPATPPTFSSSGAGRSGPPRATTTSTASRAGWS